MVFDERTHSGARGLLRVSSRPKTFLLGTGGCRNRGPGLELLISPRRAKAHSESGRYVGNGTGDLARGGGGGRSLNGIRYPSRRTDTTQGSAPIADHCRQWRDRHPPTRPKGAIESVGALSGPFALPTGVAGTAGGLGKGLALVASLVRVVSRLGSSLVVVTRRLLLTGESAGSFPMCLLNGWRRRLCCALCWSFQKYGADAGPCGRGHRWRLREPC